MLTSFLMTMGVCFTQFQPNAVRIIEAGGAGIRFITDSAEGFLHLNIQILVPNMPDEMVICEVLALSDIPIWSNNNAAIVVGYTVVGLYRLAQRTWLVEVILN